jgi:predicted RND superfamily exporter protein
MRAYEENLVPTFLTSITTSAGFISLADKDLMPVYQLGVLLSIGTMFSWIMLVTLVGPILKFFTKKINPPIIGEDGLPITVVESNKKESEFSKKYIQFIKSYKIHILVISVVLCVLSYFAGKQLEVKMNPNQQFSERVPIVKTLKLVKEKFRHSIVLNFLVDTGSIDGGKKADLLSRLDKFESEIIKNPPLNKSTSLLALLKDMNKTFNSGNEEFYQVPKTDDAVAQMLLLLSLGDDYGKINNFLSSDGRYLKVTIYSKEDDSNIILKQMDYIEAVGRKYDLNVTRSGKFPLFMELTDSVYKVMSQSAIISTLLITFIMFLLVRDLKLTLISMIPNTVPLILGAGVMYLLDFGIDIGITLVFSVCLGIAVDDTIHFIHHWKLLQDEGKTKEETLEYLIVNLNPLLIATTLILSIGFGILGFSDYLPNFKFGIMTGFILTYALLAELLILPSILFIELKKNKTAKT